MDESGKKSPGGQHYHAAGKANAELSHDPGNPVTLQQEVVHRLLEQSQVRLVLQPRSNRPLVQETIGLRTRRTDCGTLGGIQDAKLDPRLVRGDRHGSAQGVHFLDEMPLPNAPDGRVAGHLSQRFNVVGEQKSPTARPRGRKRGLGPGMAAADHDHIELGKLHRFGHENRPKPIEF